MVCAIPSSLSALLNCGVFPSHPDELNEELDEFKLKLTKKERENKKRLFKLIGVTE